MLLDARPRQGRERAEVDWCFHNFLDNLVTMAYRVYSVNDRPLAVPETRLNEIVTR